MLDDTESARLIARHPMPSIVVDTRSDRIVAANGAAERLLGEVGLPLPLSGRMANDVATAAVFFEAVAHFGSYVDRSLSLTRADGRALRLQTYGAQLGPGRVLLSLLDLDEHTRLSVVCADALESLTASPLTFDAWFLDGFAPSRNSAMWSLELMEAVFDHTRPGGSFATYAAAGFVRRNLQAAGFTVERKPGFAGKREMLRGDKP